jgi:hypothetical protein
MIYSLTWWEKNIKNITGWQEEHNMKVAVYDTDSGQIARVYHVTTRQQAESKDYVELSGLSSDSYSTAILGDRVDLKLNKHRIFDGVVHASGYIPPSGDADAAGVLPSGVVEPSGDAGASGVIDPSGASGIPPS